jgi:hypothetical protein
MGIDLFVNYFGVHQGMCQGSGPIPMSVLSGMGHGTCPVVTR